MPGSRRLVRLVAGAVGATALASGVGACGSAASQAGAPTPAVLLAGARRVIDATHAVHFVLGSRGVAGSGTQLVSGSGDLVRPGGLRGSFTLTQQGVPVSVDVVSVHGAFYVQLPLSSHYTRVSPGTFGLGNPAQLLDQRTGVSALLSAAAGGARSIGQHRIAGELVDEVAGTVPGRRVPVLPDADPAKPVTMTVAIAPGSDQIRQVTLAGPFTSATATTTYTVTLTHYGEHVTITAPPG